MTTSVCLGNHASSVVLNSAGGVLGGQAFGLKQLVAALVVCDGWRVVAACLAPPSLL